MPARRTSLIAPTYACRSIARTSVKRAVLVWTVAVLAGLVAFGFRLIDVREMAAAIGTIPWEIVCRLGSRIERVYV